MATLTLLAAGGFWAYRRFSVDAPRPLDVTSMQVTRLTQSGNASAVALSPDGRYVIYALREDEKQSLWVRQVATRSDVQVLAAEVANYQGLSFTPDGNYVYFVRTDAESSDLLVPLFDARAGRNAATACARCRYRGDVLARWTSVSRLCAACPKLARSGC